MRHKVGIVGSGHVGGEVANEIVRRNIADCVLVDAQNDLAHAKALDLSQTAPIRGSSSCVFDGGDFGALRGCEVVVLAAGLPRSPGMSRDDLLDMNCDIIKDVVPKVMSVASDVPIIVATNPLDSMTYAAWKLSGKDSKAVFGMAGVLDSTRFCSFLAAELGISSEDIHAMVLGSHGELMVPLARYASVAGIPVIDLVAPEAMKRILERTKNAGTELVSLLKTGSAYYAAGAALAAMVDCIVNDKRKVLCCSALCRGHYDIHGTFIGVPAVLQAAGIDRIIQLELNDEESKALHASADHLRQLQQRVDRRLEASGL
jgi:malate dehydrogenase